MTSERLPRISVSLQLHGSPAKPYIQATTWAVRNGVYGSIGSVRIPTADFPAPEDEDALARILLTALYGLDYDL